MTTMVFDDKRHLKFRMFLEVIELPRVEVRDVLSNDKTIRGSYAKQAKRAGYGGED